MTMSFYRLLLIFVIGPLFLAACASSKGLQPTASLRNSAELSARDTLAGIQADVASWPGRDWWKAYADPQLDALIDQALAGSPTLATARARIAQADALASAADAGRQSQLGFGAGIDRQRYTREGIFPPPVAGSTYTTGQIALNFKHEFDFWGRQQAVLEAALSRARATAVEAEAARLALTVAVARSYVELDRQYAMLDVAKALLKQRERFRDLVVLRKSAGLDNEADQHQSESAVFSARTDVAAAMERITLLGGELAALSGSGPDRGLTIARPRMSLGPAAKLPTQLASELLGRRPDVLAQRLRVQAASRDISAAQARFYPNVDLTALFGFQSINLDHLLMGRNRIVDGGAVLSLPIFDGGRLRANLRVRNADYDLAVEQYNSTLVEAMRDVADQFNSWRAIDAQCAEQSRAQAEAEAAYRLALLRYQGALSNYLAVLSVESQVLAQQRMAADLRARRLIASIGLSRALGGGFQDIASTAPASN